MGSLWFSPTAMFGRRSGFRNTLLGKMGPVVGVLTKLAAKTRAIGRGWKRPESEDGAIAAGTSSFEARGPSSGQLRRA